MHKKEFLGRTGKYTSEYRSTYTLSYRYEMPDRVVYFTQEAVENAHLDNYLGHVVESSGDYKSGGHISHASKQLLRATIACGTLEKYNTEVVFEYEIDYE